MLARYHRLRGDDVRFLTGTDENSLKNVQAAERGGIPVGASSTATPRRSAALRARSASRATTSSAPAPTRATWPASQRFWRGLRARPATSTSGLPRPLLRRLRAVLRPGRAGRWPLPRARDAARAGRGGELLLPPLALRRPRCSELIETRRAADRARVAPQRGARLHPRRPRGLQHLALAGARARLGHPGAGRPRPGDVRLVRRAGQLHHRARLRRRRRELYRRYWLDNPTGST